MIQLAEILSPETEMPTPNMRLARQIGMTRAIVNVSGVLGRVPRGRYVDTLAKVKARYDEFGLPIAGVESHPVNAEGIKLGLANRDEQIENYIAAVEALGKLGIPMVCYNWMAGQGWTRTRVDLPERGGALASEFDYKTEQAKGLTRFGVVPEEKIWENLVYFQKAVIPVAEKAGVKMALHPDDPPISPLRGIGRILTSAANYRRVMSIVPSPVNGVTFCQANFVLMGEDVHALAAQWCQEKKIFFVHYRDVQGTKEHFHETFHDNGPTNMARMLQVLGDNGFEGPIRPDHAPTLEGEPNRNPGYAMGGKVLAIGYMKGIMDSLGIPYEKPR
jgi:mannonate dehydratase